jgi:hypothetical protein
MTFLAVAAPLIGVIGSVAGAAGGLMGSGASAASANYQAQIANNSAVIAGMQRANAISAGHEQTYEESLAGSQQISRLKAAMGANGVDVNAGSNVNVIGADRAANQLSAETTLAKAQKAAWGYQLQEEGYHDQSQLYSSEAKSEKTAGLIKAGTGLIGGKGSVAEDAGTGMFGSASPTANSFDWGDTPDGQDE